MSRLTYHLVTAGRWAALDRRLPYTAPSLGTEGFIHCTDGREALIATANRHYRSQPGPFLALTLDLDLAGSPWQFDDGSGIYPHVYGPIAAHAIVAVQPLERDASGLFTGFAGTAEPLEVESP